jgi:type IV pilus assembly protein PilQ
MFRANTRHTASRRASRRGRLVAALLSANVVVLTTSLGWADATVTVNHVKNVSMHPTEGVTGGTEIEVALTASPTFNARVAEGGKRLLVDIVGADVTGAPEAITNGSGVVGGVLTQSFKTDAGTLTRVSISLAKSASYRVRADGNVLRISLAPADKTGPSDGPPKPTEPAKDEPKVEVVLSEISDVKFERLPPTQMSAAKDRLVIGLTAIPSYALSTTSSGRLRLELKSCKVPENLGRTLDVSAYKGFLKNVGTFFDGTTGVTVIEIERNNDAVQGAVQVDGKNLIWTFDVPKGTEVRAPIAKSTRKTVTVAREAVADGGPKIETSIHGGETPEAKIETTTAGGEAGFAATINAQQGGGGRYTGRRIDLDLKDADIHNILRLLADVGRVNIVTADDVAGNITIRMRNVPWDQALDVVLQAKGLGMVRSGNLIRVAPLAQLQKERELRLAAARQEFELTPLETRLIPISYAQAEEMQARAHDLLSPRGSLSIDERTNTLIARDITGNINYIEELVRTLDTQTPQVLVEARIVEATSRYLRDVGIQWGGDATFSEATGNPTGVAFPSRASVAGGNFDNNTPTAGVSPFQRQVQTPNFAVNLPAAVGTGQGGALGFSFGSIDNNLNLGLRLSAAETSGLVRIVSSPRILTLNNREARINQGTLIPFSQVSAQGVQTTFQEAKLQLLVRPHVTADGSVAMHVKINRDEPDFNQTSARGDPTILKREAETDLLVMDGHTAVIGGIFTRNTGRNLDQVPFFGDIPILGILFQRRRANDTRNELVIFLTPRIVNRAEAIGR